MLTPHLLTCLPGSEGGGSPERADEPTPSSSVGAKTRGPGLYLFALLSLLGLPPLWLCQHAPIVDLPGHLFLAELFVRRVTVGGLGGAYSLLSVPSPYVLWEIVLAALCLVFSPPTAGRLLLSAYVIALPLASWFLCSTVSKKHANLAYLVFPFIWCRFFLMGYLPFFLTLPIALVAIAHFWSRGRSSRPGCGLVLSGLLLLCYFGHLSVYLALLATLAGLCLTQPNRRRAFRALLLSAAPSLGLLVLWRLFQPGFGDLPSVTGWEAKWRGLQRLLFFPAPFGLLGLLGLTLARLRFRLARALLAPLGALLLLWLLCPVSFGALFEDLDTRFLFFAALLVPAAYAASAGEARPTPVLPLRRWLPALALVSQLCAFAWFLGYRPLDREFSSMERLVPPRATLGLVARRLLTPDPRDPIRPRVLWRHWVSSRAFPLYHYAYYHDLALMPGELLTPPPEIFEVGAIRSRPGATRAIAGPIGTRALSRVESGNEYLLVLRTCGYRPPKPFAPEKTGRYWLLYRRSEISRTDGEP